MLVTYSQCNSINWHCPLMFYLLSLSPESSQDQLSGVNGTLAAATSSVSLGHPLPLTSCSSLPVSSSALHAPPQLKMTDILSLNGISSAVGSNLLAASQVQPLTSSTTHGSPLLVSTPSSPPTHQVVSQRVSTSPQPRNGGSKSSIKMSDPLPPLSLVNTVGMKMSEDGPTTSVTTPSSPYPIQQGMSIPLSLSKHVTYPYSNVHTLIPPFWVQSSKVCTYSKVYSKVCTSLSLSKHTLFPFLVTFSIHYLYHILLVQQLGYQYFLQEYPLPNTTKQVF